MQRLCTLSTMLLLALAISSTCFAQCGETNANSPYGINFHAPAGMNLSVLADEVNNCGIGWIRVDFNWLYMEPSQDSFSWGMYDAIVSAANSRGLLIFASIGYTPQWATDGSEQTGVPRNSADWYDICYRSAQRYDGNHGKGYINYWGMWNEANLDGFWEGTRQQYIDIILKNGADAIHAGNPNAKVCGPEMAHLTSGDKDWYDWLKDCIEQAGSKLDVCTHHNYSGTYGEVTDDLENSTLFGGNPSMWGVVAPSVKEVLQYTGWYGKPFWLTETGWQSGEVGESAQASNYNGLLTDWCTGQSGRGWLHRIFFYETNDDPINWPYSWGILVLNTSTHQITQRKQAYTTYKNFITAHPTAPSAPCQATNPNPANQATGVTTTADLTWTAGKGATSHKVYFGTSNPPPYIGTQTGTTYDPGTMLQLTTHYWRIDEVNSAGTTTGQVWSFTTASSDTQPPSAPTNVQVTAQSPTSIQVTWTASTDNVGVAGYKIYRNGGQVGTTSMVSYNDAGLQPNTTYSYTVSAYDAQGNNSAQSSPPATATTQQGAGGQWLWQADNHSGSAGSYSSNWTDMVHTFTESRTSGGWYWSWDDPAASNARLKAPGGTSGRSWLQSNSFGENWSVDTGITIAARVKPISIDGRGTIMLSVNNSSTADLNSPEDPGATSTHIWVGWEDEGTTDKVTFVSKAGTDLKIFTSSVPFRNTWCIWTLAGKQIGTTMAWDLWINGTLQDATVRASDGTYHTYVWSKSTDMGTSVVIGQRRPEATDYDTIWDYVGVTNYGVVPGWDGISPVGDTQSPSVPTNVTATGLTMNSIQVGWTASTDNVGVAGYKVYRNGAQVGTSATTSYTNTGLTPSTTYSYTVSAYDAQGNNSAQSSPPAQGTTLGDTQPPSVPTGVAVTTQTPTTVKITWTASTDNVAVTGYKIYRNGAQAATASTPGYTDTGLTPNTLYSYTISAYDAAANNSAQSSPPVTVTTMTAMDIDEAKELADTASVGMISKTVTAIYSGCFYVEEADRYSSIKVVPTEMPGGLAVGSVVDVGGTMQTASGERYIGAATVSCL